MENVLKKQAVIAILSFFLGTGIGLAQGKIITISTGEYAPYSSESLPHGGFVTHVISEAFGLEGYQAEFHFLPWKRALETAKSGQYQATSFWAHTSETEEEYRTYFYRSDPVFQATVVFFHLRSNPMRDWETTTDLTDYRIGTMIGETSTKILIQDGLTVENVGSAAQNMKKILLGRIDIFPLEVMTGLDLLQAQFSPEDGAKISYDPKPFFKTPASLLFSKQREGSIEYLKIFNRGLAKMVEQGRYDQLYQDLLSGKYK